MLIATKSSRRLNIPPCSTISIRSAKGEPIRFLLEIVRSWRGNVSAAQIAIEQANLGSSN